MKKFNKRIAPIIVIMNFMIGMQLFIKLFLLSELYDDELRVCFIWLILFFLVNGVAIVVARRKYGSGFAITGHMFFVIAIPLILPAIMYGIFELIGVIADML